MADYLSKRPQVRYSTGGNAITATSGLAASRYFNPKRTGTPIDPRDISLHRPQKKLDVPRKK